MSIEGLFFYWVAWLFWIFATFFVKKTEVYRLRISVCILVTIILEPYQFVVLGFQMNMALAFLYFFFILNIAKQKKISLLYTLICSYIIMMAYASFLLFELYDPVWVLLDRTWLLGITLSYLCVLVQQNNWNRVYVLAIGMIQGDFIYSLVLGNIGFVYPIGTEQFFDCLAASIMVLCIWSFAEAIMVNMDQYLDSHIRGKQKST